MEENKIDKIIKDKFDKRELTPSVSSWERMENMLDDNKGNSKKRRFYFISVAASIVVILGVYFGMDSNQLEDIKNIPIEEPIIVTVPEELIKNDVKNETEINSTITLIKENQVVASTIKKTDYSKNNKSLTSVHSKEVINTKSSEIPSSTGLKNHTVVKSDIPIIKSEEKNESSIKNSRIRVKGDDLLYAVTHSPDEVKEYYANLKLERSDVLDSIKIKLKKSNLKINPEVILAEVERSIEDDMYQGNFKNNLGRRISTIIVAVANRNK